MTRFAYLTDTHLGCDETGYQLQPRYHGRDLAALFEGLARWIEEQAIDFVVHGGDLTDHGSDDEIERARELCARLGVPVHLCLGNHDLEAPGAIERWRACGELLPSGADCFRLDAGDAAVVVTAHHWHPHVDYQWLRDDSQTPRIDAQQEAQLDALLGDETRPVIAVTHAPLNAVPCAQTGDAEPFHPPHAPYLATWRRLAERHANLRLVLTGHNHAHSQHDHGSFVSCTTAAFNEAPAQLRLIEIADGRIVARTVALAEALDLPRDIDPAKAWTVGRAADHHLRIALERV
ncbi:MAG: metallophosphoesterase family protein, partial [Phycisphaeraceae bacterium]